MKTVRSAVRCAAACVVFVWLLASCGASAREKTISATLNATNAASAAFVKYDAAHQQDIVKTATDKVVAKAELDAWRANQLEIERYLVAVYQAVAAEAVADSDANFNGMVQAALYLSQALKTLGITP